MKNSRPYRNRCDQILDHLYDYLNRRDLTSADVQEIRRHLDECPPCGGRFAFEEHLVDRLRASDPGQCPDTLRRRVKALLNS